MLYDTIANRFNLLKDKHKKLETQESYENMLSVIVSSMFEYEHKGVANIDFTIFELSLLATGLVAVWKDGDNIVVTPCECVGHPDKLGRGKDLICYFVGGTKRFSNWKDSNEVVVVFNNELGESDYTIDRYASYLTETDISASACLRNCRYSSIIPVEDTKQQAVLDEVLQKCETGTPQAFVSSNIAEKLFTDTGETKVLHLTDVKNSDKLQYISHYRDDLFRQFFTLYGMSTNSTSKMAQQTTAEITDANNSSNILPLNMLKWRKYGIDEINSTFGTTWGVKLSECWEKQIKKPLNVSRENIEESEVIENEEDRKTD